MGLQLGVVPGTIAFGCCFLIILSAAILLLVWFLIKKRKSGGRTDRTNIHKRKWKDENIEGVRDAEYEDLDSKDDT